MLLIIDTQTWMLLIFCTANKRPPLIILDYFFTLLTKENRTVHTIHVDEDGAFTWNQEFSKFLLQKYITLEMTGGHASFLNGNFE
jgi:hypothetical protein